MSDEDILVVHSDGDKQPCPSFGIHQKLPFVRTLYERGDLSFLPNVGALVEPMTAAQFSHGGARKCVGLFSHSDQKDAVQTLVCQIAGKSPRGVGGRIGDALS